MAVKEIDRSKMKEYNIYAGLGGGFGGKKYQYTGLFESHEDAEHEAWAAACEEYDSYEGANGLGTYADAMEEAYGELGWDRDDEDPELVAYANEVFDSYMEDWIEYCAIPTDEDTETDKEDLIRDYIIEDDNNTCETGCE
jgi:hypothetical protein|nr:MAG TPA: hypothetical protein [Caudoviricetes sp.]